MSVIVVQLKAELLWYRVVAWVTMLQAGRSRVRFPMRLINEKIPAGGDSRAWTVFDRSEDMIAGSNPALGTDV
jgi:hypothetical protein